MVRIATILATCNSDNLTHLKYAVESLQSQTLPTDVFILEDGALPEGSHEYLAELARRGSIRDLAARPGNSGLAVSLNQLIQTVLACNRYDYVARMDADDVSLPTRLEKQAAFLDVHEDVDCLGTCAIEVNEDGTESYRKKLPTDHEACVRFFMKRDFLIHSTVVFRTRYFEKAGLYPNVPLGYEDTLMWAEGIRKGCRFANLPEYELLFRVCKGFYRRRRGVSQALRILKYRCRVNRSLGYPPLSYCYALAYSAMRLLPTPLVKQAYLHLR